MFRGENFISHPSNARFSIAIALFRASIKITHTDTIINSDENEAYVINDIQENFNWARLQRE